MKCIHWLFLAVFLPGLFAHAAASIKFEIDPFRATEVLFYEGILDKNDLDPFGELPPEKLNGENLKKLLRKRGVPMPDGTTIQVAKPYAIITTPKGLSPEAAAKVQEAIADISPSSQNVEILASFIGFSEDVIDAIQDTDFPGIPDSDALIKLAHQRKGTVLARFKLHTFDGDDVQATSVEEWIYPTEFDVSENDIHLSRYKNPGNQHATTLPFIPPTVIPGAFETREIGFLLTARPNISIDGKKIVLTVDSELSSIKEWQDYGVSFSLTDAKNTPPKCRSR